MRRLQNFGYLGRIVEILYQPAKYILRYCWRRIRNQRPVFITPAELRFSLERLGATFIKFGQLLSMRSDYIPLEYCAELQNLLDRVPPVPYDRVQEIVRTELGADAKTVFLEFAERPLASASFGQVHPAKLRSGEAVAVKVQRPALRTTVEQDIHIMYLLARLLDWSGVLGKTKAQTAVHEFAAWTREELDYTIEGRNADLIRLKASEDDTVKIPKVFWPYSSSRILTMELVRGVSLNDVIEVLRDRDPAALEEYRRQGVDTQAVARKLHQSSLKQILMDGIFHADPHPANLLVLNDGTLAYVDFGIVGRLDEHARAVLLEYMEAVARGDLQETFHALCKIGIITSRTDLKGFEQDIKSRTRQWYEDVTEGVASVRDRSMAVYMIDTMRIIQERGMGIPFDILSFYRTVIAVDSVILQIAPAFDPLEDAREVFGQWKIESLLRMLSVRSSLQTAGRYRDLVSSLPQSINRIFHRPGFAVRCVESESEPSMRLGNRRVAFIAIAVALLLFPITLDSTGRENGSYARFAALFTVTGAALTLLRDRRRRGSE